MQKLDSDSLIELKPTLRLVIKIWWAYAWRLFILFFLIIVMITLPVTLIMGLQGYSIEQIRITGATVGGILSWTVWWWIMIIPFKLIIGKQFKGFRLVLIKTYKANGQARVIETSQGVMSQGKRMAAALEKLAALNTFSEISDPVEWQREQRQDRSLPDRNV